MGPQLGAVPNPDPTVRTVDQLQRDIGASREIVESKLDGHRLVTETRLAGNDKAIELLQRTADRIPDLIKDAVRQLQSLVDEKFESVEARTEIQFQGIATQFAERDKRGEQLSVADKTAINAALAAQEKQASAYNESSSTANTKMETNFTKLIEQMAILLQSVTKNTDDKINDIKSRLDKGEGRTSVSDPAVIDALRSLGGQVAALTTNANLGKGAETQKDHTWAFVVALVGIAAGIIPMIVLVLKLMK